MYPYRRHNQRKRPRNAARRNKGNGRRLPGTARELLPLIQPATKALAQVLAGNTKASGQFVHARNMVERADQMVVEKQLDRLNIRDREDFLEQLALLKLTVNDAEEEFGPLEAEPDEDTDEEMEADGEAVAEEPVDEEAARAAADAERQRAEAEAEEHRARLKRVALALMAPSAEAAPAVSSPLGEMVEPPPTADVPPRRSRSEQPSTRTAARGGTPRRPRITLRSSGKDGESGADEQATGSGVASET